MRVYFSQWGPVVDAIVIREPNTKQVKLKNKKKINKNEHEVNKSIFLQSRGFGFVTFATVYSAEAAIADRPHIIAGKTVRFSPI